MIRLTMTKPRKRRRESGKKTFETSSAMFVRSAMIRNTNMKRVSGFWQKPGMALKDLKARIKTEINLREILRLAGQDAEVAERVAGKIR